MAHPKGLLMERLSKQGAGKPDFRTANTGPAHQPTFLSDVLVDGEVYGTGQGSTKREAERLAAEEALRYLERNPLELGPRERQETKQGREREQKQEPEPEPVEGFEGPWPLFEDLLAASLQIANQRIDPRLADSEARVAVRDFALQLYKELLEDLGDVVEEDEDE